MASPDLSQDDARPKVSVLVPIYNSEEHLDRCLESARQQSLADIEIVCVDDGSSDTSSQIVSEHACKDPRVKLISHQRNLGEGAARNTALDKAQGDYIFHLDSDDTIPEDALAILYSQAFAYHSDMVKGGMQIVDDDGKTSSAEWTVPPGREVNTDLARSEFLQEIPTSHCTYLYKRAFLEKHHIRYPLDLRIGLDIVTLAEALIRAQSITLVTDIIYRYHLSATSVTRSGLTTDYVIDSIRAKKRISDALSDAGFHGLAQSHLQHWGFIVGDLWMNMPTSLPQESWTKIFAHFRSLIASYSVIPWHHRVPFEHRYLFSLIINNCDEQAVTFLHSQAPLSGFSDPAELEESLRYILTIAPDDASCLMKLGSIKAQQDKVAEAAGYFRKAASYSDHEIDAKLALAESLERLARPDQARQALQGIVEHLDRSPPAEQVKQLYQLKDRIDTALNQQYVQRISHLDRNLQEARNEIASARQQIALDAKAIESLKSSYSWRLTAPIRYLAGLFSRRGGKGWRGDLS